MGFERESERQPLGDDEEAELRRAAMADAASELADLDLASSEIDRFYALTNASQAAALLGRYETAQELAEELLALAPSYRTNWNYGNAIHHAHTALGLVALASGNIAQAIEHLLASGETPGSPQLNTFGPSMALARALMREGQFTSAAEYLKRCRAFWEMGGEWVDTWQEMVAHKVVPNCVMHAFR
jgi:tetratricopeptide (TPR) repeat protein